VEISAKIVKELRDKTGVGMMDCKDALRESNGDFEKAVDYLRKKSLATAERRSTRTASSGLVSSYIHFNNSIGVLIEVNCETDFVANTDQFKDFVSDIAMHIAAANPAYLKREDVKEDVLKKEKEIYMLQAQESGKPEKILEQIAEGKLTKFFKDNCLMEQAFVKNPDISIYDYLMQKVGQTGEKIEIKRFVRFALGEV
jgi:elongation factor Ts